MSEIEAPEYDVSLREEGNLVLFYTHTPGAACWVDQNVSIPSHLRTKKYFAVEWGYADALIRGLIQAGFTVSGPL